MPLMACPQCGQNVSSLASVCPQCSFSLREQRLKEGQLGPQITCRKCRQKISVKATVCPYCGIDFPKRTFNFIMVGIPLGALLLVLAIVSLLPEDEGVPNPVTTPAPLSTEPPAITPPQTDVVLEEPNETLPTTSVDRAQPIVVETPPRAAGPEDTSVRPTTRWTANWVNVRRNPAADAFVVQIMDPGVRVEVGAFEDGFWEVFVEGRRIGYVANSLLLREPPEQ